jgi:Kef-type K+ transport system membrane component KefB
VVLPRAAFLPMVTLCVLVSCYTYTYIHTHIKGGLAKGFGLTNGDAVRLGLLLSGGGEFAFVVLNMAKNLEVI